VTWREGVADNAIERQSEEESAKPDCFAPFVRMN
jgi:hypothetical protein